MKFVAMFIVKIFLGHSLFALQKLMEYMFLSGLIIRKKCTYQENRQF